MWIDLWVSKMHASAASSGNKEGSGPEVEGSEPACAHDSPPCDQTLEAIQPAAASLLRGEGGRYVASAASNMFIEGEPRGDEELRPGDGERMSRGTGEPMRDIDTVVRPKRNDDGLRNFCNACAQLEELPDRRASSSSSSSSS